MKTIRVGVSGINAVDDPGPGVGVARSLKEDKGLDVKVVGLAYDAMDPGIYLDWIIDKAYIVPYPSSGHEAFMERLLYIKKSYGLDFIFPCLDTELPLYIKYKEELDRHGIRTLLPTQEQFKIRGKDRLAEVAKEIDVRIPKTDVVSSYSQLTRSIEKIGLPIMVKGLFYKAYIAYTVQEATAHYNKIVTDWGYPIIVQQVVSGEEMNVVGVGDGEGGLLGMVGIKKILVTTLGKIWTGVTVNNEKMLSSAEKFIREYKWKGPFELECIVNREEVFLIEINPRFPAWSYFATGVGINLPANMLRRAFQLPLLGSSDYEAGKLFVRYTYELITDMRQFRNISTKAET